MDLKSYALKLKLELQQTPSTAKAKEIANRISKANHTDGTPLSEVEKNHILNYIKFPKYDHITGKCYIQGSDNSDFLKLVAIVTENTSAK